MKRAKTESRIEFKKLETILDISSSEHSITTDSASYMKEGSDGRSQLTSK